MLWLIYGVEELGIPPGVLGTIAAVGGIASIGGAVYGQRITRRLGIGPTIVVGHGIFALAVFLIPAASGPVFVAPAFLLVAQLADAPWTVYLINETSLKQAITPGNMLGRVNASNEVIHLTGSLIGTLMAGILAEFIGLRATLMIGGVSAVLAVEVLAVSPVLKTKELPDAAKEGR